MPTDLPTAEDLNVLKGDRSVALLIPALDEEGTIVGLLRALHEDRPVRALLDEVVVIDGGSSDATARLAARHGARVVHAEAIAAEHPAGGKGGSVWRALQATTSELLVVVDADLDPFEPRWISALLAPLVLDDGIHLVKAASERPLLVDGILYPGSGGRVTELMARPVLNALWPELAGLAQPLSGELAGRRSLLESLSIPTGYGLEIGMLVDTLQAVGLDGIAQVEVGERRHRNQSDLALGRMASAVLRTALSRSGLPLLPADLVQFGLELDELGGPARRRLVHSCVPLEELPPVSSLRQAV